MHTNPLLPPPVLAGGGAGFTATLTDAARSLGVTPEGVVDMVRAGCLTALVVSAYETTERPPLRFDPDALAVFATTLRAPSGATSPQVLAVSEVYAVSSGVRAFLRERTPTDTDVAAIAETRALLAPARDRVPYAHVLADHVRPFVVARAARPLTRVRLASPGILEDTLELLGFRQVRGIRPVGGGSQSWRRWWRVPLSVWSLAEEDVLRVDDLPALGGTERSGEEADVPGVARGEGEDWSDE